MPEAKGRSFGRGLLCSAETLARKAIPFVDTVPENKAVVRGGHLILGRGRFCQTHRTSISPGRRAGGGIARFSAATGKLNVVDERGKILW